MDKARHAKEISMAKCKICGARVGEGSSSCPVCGATAAAAGVASGIAAPAGTTRPSAPSAAGRCNSSCPVCGAGVMGEHRFCPQCGNSLSSSTDMDRHLAEASQPPQPQSLAPAVSPVSRVEGPSSDELIEHGIQLLDGNPPPSRQRDAFRCFEQALDMGNAVAHLWLGICHLHGIGTEENGGKAFHHFYEAHYADLIDGTAMMGACYYYGVGVEPDEETGKRYLKDARDAGSSEAQSILKGIKKDKKKMRKEMEREMQMEYERQRMEAEERDAATAAAIGAGVFLGGALLGALFS